MKAKKIVQAACAVSIVAIGMFGLSACAGDNDQESGKKVSGLTGGVAATVNGVDIQEDTVTTYIETSREGAGLSDESNWGQWLVENDITPETLREETIESFISQELIRQAAESEGISIEGSEVQENVDKMRSNYGSDEEWESALTAAGLTEESYSDAIELALMEQSLREKMGEVDEPTDEELLEYTELYVSVYDGAKKSSQILFDTNDEATAREVLDKIRAGELDFGEAAAQYSIDTSSASHGGEVGWDKLSSLGEEYSEALANLGEGEISDLIESDQGLFIIKCTEVFTAPEVLTELDQVPSEFLTMIESSYETTKKSEAFNNWFKELREQAEVVINPMPENVPYNIDLSKYTKTEPDGSQASTDDPVAEPDEGDTGQNEGQKPDGANTEDSNTGEGAPEGEGPSEDATGDEAPEKTN